MLARPTLLVIFVLLVLLVDLEAKQLSETSDVTGEEPPNYWRTRMRFPEVSSKELWRRIMKWPPPPFNCRYSDCQGKR